MWKQSSLPWKQRLSRTSRNRLKQRSNRRHRRMPSKSKAQERLMAAAAHDKKFAKKVGVPQKVAKEFNQADKAKKGKR